jgi:2-polyprenyl-6-methoxyphenol hydroxylase-like FAD-dependent oxidoreductase
MQAMNIGIAGGGVGGLTAAIALRRAGHEVTVYEQSKQWMRVGADINLTPNVVRALDGLGGGIGARIRAEGPPIASAATGIRMPRPLAWAWAISPRRSTARLR